MKNRKWFKIIGIGGLIFLLVIVSAITFFLKNKNTVTPDYIIKENVSVISSETGKNIIPIEVQEDRLIFGRKQNYSKGDVIVSGITDVTPDGFIRKVKSVEKDGEQYIVYTEDAYLTDVFEEAHIKETFVLTDEGEIYDAMEAENYLERAPSGLLLCTHIPNIYEAKGENTKKKLLELLDNDSDKYLLAKEFEYKLEGENRIRGDIGVGGKLVVDVDIEDGDIEINMTVKFNYGGELELGCSEGVTCEIEKLFLEKTLPNIQFFVGIVPIVITNDMEIRLEGEIATEGTVGMGIELDNELVAGFSYDSKTNKVKEIKEKKYGADGIEFDVGASVESETSIGVMVHLITKLYGSTGTDISAGLQAKAVGEISVDFLADENEMPLEGSLDLSIEPVLQGDLVVHVPVVDDELVSKSLFEVNLPAFWEKHLGTSDAGGKDLGKEKANKSINNDMGVSVNGIEDFYGYDLPLVFSFDYTYTYDPINNPYDYNEFYITDAEGYYLVKGSLLCPECVPINVNLAIGESFITGSGHKYTVVEEQVALDGQGKKIILERDGDVYYIEDTQMVQYDAFTGAGYYPIVGSGEKYYKTVYENVYLRVEDDTHFTDGKNDTGTSFDFAVKSGWYEDCSTGLEYDIHFTENGVIDIFSPLDIGSNGIMEWYGEETARWVESLG